MSLKTANPAVEHQLADIAEQLAAVETERAADPLSTADDVASWQEREADRTSRSVALASRAEILRRDGILAADPAIAAIIETFEKEARRARTALRDNGIRVNTGWNSPKASLEAWVRLLEQLGSGLPVDDPAAARLLAGKYEEFFAARDEVYRRLADSVGHQLPHPEGETGDLPAGLRRGVQIATT